jgi:hypothetical protein
LEVFEESETVRLVVVPDVVVLYTLFHGADGVFPPINVIEPVAMGETTAGKANESGLKVSQGLG